MLNTYLVLLLLCLSTFSCKNTTVEYSTLSHSKYVTCILDDAQITKSDNQNWILESTVNNIDTLPFKGKLDLLFINNLGKVSHTKTIIINQVINPYSSLNISCKVDSSYFKTDLSGIDAFFY